MEMTELCRDIVSWLREKVFSSGGRGAVFGLSGGIDSAVVAVLCKRAFADDCLGLIMPCHSREIDREHAELVANKFAIPSGIINLDRVFDEMLLALEGKKRDEGGRNLARANIKPRLRMNVLYYYAALDSYRVIGTGNKSEISIGYFSKYGDAGVDFEPIGDLLKEEVRELAVYLEIPAEIIDKKPTAGLWEGQTDEDEMGFTYRELDRYLKGERIDASLETKIESMRQGSEHKRHVPPIFTRKL
ncbi:MAG: NAD(+) synthase [Dethiobacter sp.]|jgi:NAD+ synthase|nr:MAG: NAD(+) synthase [Dethiobacter sp.]